LLIFIIFPDRYKREGKETKETLLIGTGFNSCIDHIFWYLPFSNVNQANATLNAIKGVTEDDWETKPAEIAEQLTLEKTE
jgi:hypothetical protein